MEKILLELKEENGVFRQQNLEVMYSKNIELPKYYSLLSTDDGITVLKSLFESLWETISLSSGSYPNWDTFVVYVANKLQDFKTARVQEMRFLTIGRESFLYGFGNNANASSKTISLFVLAL